MDAQNGVGEHTVLHMGEAVPRHRDPVPLTGSDRGNFSFAPEEALDGKLICATGQIAGTVRRAEMTVTQPSALALGVTKG